MEQMSFGAFVELGAQLALVVAAIVEMVKNGVLKRLALKWGWIKDDHYEPPYVIAVTFLAWLVGLVVAAFATQRYPQLSFLGAFGIKVGDSFFNDAVNVFLIGSTIAFGNQFWHQALDFVKAVVDGTKGWADKQYAQANAIAANTPRMMAPPFNETK